MSCPTKKGIVIKGSGVPQQTAIPRQDTAHSDVLKPGYKGTGIIWSDRLTFQDGGTFVLTVGYWQNITAATLMKPKYPPQDDQLGSPECHLFSEE